MDSHAELTGLANPAEFGLLATRLSACSFDYSPGTPSRKGLIAPGRAVV